MTSAATPPRPGSDAASINPARVAFATFLGTALEWYDFFLFGTMATIALAPLFFPGGDPATESLRAFLSFAVAFIARPIGAAVFGHYGDKIGRRGVLVATVMLMGVVSVLIGMLPTYATIGVWAPILLTVLRAFQGLAAGGEWGGATLMAMEFAPEKHRSMYAAIVQLGSPAGTLLSSGMVALVTLLPRETFLAWGWRIPFLISIVLTVLALWIRNTIPESPEFVEAKEADAVTSAPLVELLKTLPGRLFIGVCVYLVGNAGFFLFTTFMISYVTRILELPAASILSAMTIGALAQVVFTVGAGSLAGRIGPVRTAIIGYTIFLVVIYPVFLLVDTRNYALMVLAMVIAFGPCAISYAVVGAVLDKLFPVHLKYSGLGLSANLSGIIAGFMPAMGTLMLGVSSNASWGPGLLGVTIGVISLVGTISAQRIIAAQPTEPGELL